jgi:hypothetical protein
LEEWNICWNGEIIISMKTTSKDIIPISLMQLDNSDINASLKISDLENIFGVYQDKRGNLVYDLN